MNARQHAIRLAVLKAIRERIDSVDAVARDEAKEAFVAGDRVTAALDDGTVVGSVTMTNPRRGWKVADPISFLAWVIENRPSAVVQSVRESDRRAILAAIDKTGELPDGVVEYEGTPTLSVRPDYDAIAELDWRPYLSAAEAAAELTPGGRDD